MKVVYKSRRNQSSSEIMMTPMIDVVFLLLIFFLSTASFEIVEQLFPTNVSVPNSAGQGASPEPPEVLSEILAIDDCIVKIISPKNGSSSCSYSLNGQFIESELEMTKRIERLISIRSDIPIIIDPEDDVPIDLAVRLYDSSRSAGGVYVYFATR